MNDDVEREGKLMYSFRLLLSLEKLVYQYPSILFGNVKMTVLDSFCLCYVRIIISLVNIQSTNNL